MNTIRKIVKNTLSLLIAQVSVIFFNFFYYIYTARYLGAENFGILSFAIAFTGILYLLADLGLKTLITRDISRDESLAPKYLGNVSALKILLSIATFSTIAFIINISDYPEQTINVVYIITISFILKSFVEMFYSIFQAFEKMEYISIGRFFDSSLMFVGVLIAMKLNLEVTSFVYIYLLTNTIVLLYSSLTCLIKFVTPTFELNISFWREMLRESLPFWLTTVFVIIYFKIDIVMLSIMKGDVVVGWYAAPYRLIDALILLPGILMTVMYPIYSKYYINSKESLNVAFKKSIKILVIVALPIGVGTTLLAEEIILLFYGNDYIPSITALKILVWASVLSFLNFTPSTLLNATNRQRTLMIITCLGAMSNITLNFLFIPTMSYAGAGIATVITEIIVGLLMAYEINKFQKEYLQNLHITIFKSTFSAFAMGAIIIVSKSFNLFLLIILAASFYLIVLFITHIFEEDEIKIIINALKRLI